MWNDSAEITALAKELKARIIRTSELAEQLATLTDSRDSSGASRGTGPTERAPGFVSFGGRGPGDIVSKVAATFETMSPGSSCG